MLIRRCFVALLALSLAPIVVAQDAQKPATGDGNGDVRVGTADRPKRAKSLSDGVLRLAAYNVENLFDHVDDPALSGEFDDMKEPTSDERCKALAKVIREIDADVLCLEEVESRECLAWFNETYLGDRKYPYIASIDAGYNRGVEQSVMSRIPIESARVFMGEDRVISDMLPRCTPDEAKRLKGEWSPPSKGSVEVFQRSPLRVDLKSKDGYELTVFVVHFKAGGRDFAQHRELEALQVEAFVGDVLAANSDANIAVVGDYNATPGDMAAKVIRWRDGFASAYDWRADKKAEARRYQTHASERAIDYILMSSGMAADCVEQSFVVWGTPQRPKQDWSKYPYPPGYASDHCALTIDLNTKPDRPASAFKRPSGDEPDAGTAAAGGGKSDSKSDSKTGARTDVRSDASAPTEAELKEHAKPTGSAPKSDAGLAKKLRDAGWEYMLPYPKSKAASWSKQGGNTTWWPGYWRNGKTSKTSRMQPEAKDGFKGDGREAPSGKDYTNTGAPGRVTWIEWLCSAQGAADGK
ncbi:MAG: hypothetical protein RIT24_1013 [Planctomycetota bacterium]